MRVAAPLLRGAALRAKDLTRFKEERAVLGRQPRSMRPERESPWALPAGHRTAAHTGYQRFIRVVVNVTPNGARVSVEDCRCAVRKASHEGIRQWRPGLSAVPHRDATDALEPGWVAIRLSGPAATDDLSQGHLNPGVACSGRRGRSAGEREVLYHLRRREVNPDADNARAQDRLCPSARRSPASPCLLRSPGDPWAAHDPALDGVRRLTHSADRDATSRTSREPVG